VYFGPYDAAALNTHMPGAHGFALCTLACIPATQWVGCLCLGEGLLGWTGMAQSSPTMHHPHGLLVMMLFPRSGPFAWGHGRGQGERCGTCD
jgi:hypothetical protein